MMKELSMEELSLVSGGWQSQGATRGDMGSPHEGRGNNRGSGNGGNNRNTNPNNTWNTNDSLSATVIRNAGVYAIAGAPGGLGLAAAGGVLGAMVGFSEYNNHGSNASGGRSSGKGNSRGSRGGDH